MSDSKASQASATRKWDVPAIDGSSGQGYLTASRLEELQKQAWDEAFQQGHAEGLKAGEEELARRAARYDELLMALAKPFDLLDESVEKQLVELSVTIVKQLFRREIKLDPSHVIGVVRETIRLLPIASRNVQVRLHPEDAALVQQSLSPAEGERAWVIVEDPLISRGGCKVTTENSRIDAQTETRLNAAINAILGDERHA
ncbi:MAG: flagellar assembly protein FliH [Gammaproteobacteria bacterium]|nr:flagellar assembly protein FliH [Gammaproteobacteria bacterium]MDH4313261.1 flagellar assembly protein FliH [Gammaproteobacteria bacterium]MDH5212938.1 flagellar assembly protein FliH [Gammaproteobacteria bacterium]MDH5500209.1 flagellar assembly protein FliH [Gammaproteobacteria bacterium]